jgi:hypothetical protein
LPSWAIFFDDIKNNRRSIRSLWQRIAANDGAHFVGVQILMLE